VVRSFNQDKPYNQFILEQIAGDLMKSEDDDLRNERITATGFLVLGPKVLAEQDKPKFVMDIVDEQIEVTSKAFLGLTVACARCHNHKFDPISARDYYALAGIFKSSRTMADLGFVSNWMERPVPTRKDREARTAYEAQRKEAESRLTAAKFDIHTRVQARLWEKGAQYLRAGYEIAQQGGALSLAEAPRRPGDVLLEAEAFARGNLYRDTDNFGKGIGVVINVQSPDFAEWDFTVPKAGLYQIEFRYAAQESRPMRLKINGALALSDACKSVTGSWFPEGQRWEPQGVFALKAGKNILRIEQDQYIPHLDKLLIVPAPERGGKGGRPPRPLDQIAKEFDIQPDVARGVATALASRKDDPVFGAFLAFANLPEEAFADRAATLAQEIAEGKTGATPAVRRLFANFRPKTLSEAADRYGELFGAELHGNACRCRPGACAAGDVSADGLDPTAGEAREPLHDGRARTGEAGAGSLGETGPRSPADSDGDGGGGGGGRRLSHPPTRQYAYARRGGSARRSNGLGRRTLPET
jgi:hypothetical protein